MVQVNYSSDQWQQIEQLRSYVEDYCQKSGIDPTMYTTYLDGKKATLDPQILNDPVFQAYWQLAYLQLMEIVNPAPVISAAGEIGEEEFDAVYENASPEMDSLVRQILADNPDLVELTAQMKGQNPADVRALLTGIKPPQTNEVPDATSNVDYRDDEARDVQQELGLNGGMWDWLIDTEEGIKSTENWLLVGLAEMDNYLAELDDAVRKGEMNGGITPEQYKAKTEQISQNRTLYIGMIQQLEDALGRMIETFSNLLKARSEAQSAITRNLNVSA